MNRFEQQRACCRWRRFSHKAYAVFQSLHSEVCIGVLGVTMLSACTFANPPGEEQLQQGDLLFCIEEDGSEGLGGAIAAVTEGVASQSITHVAVVVDRVHVVEATPLEGVRVKDLSQWLADAGQGPDGKPLVVAGRLRDTLGLSASVERIMKYVGRPYDFLYQPDDSAIYCSELVQLSYQRPDGRPVFEQQPMSFSDSTGQIDPYWAELYAKHQMEVPEGAPGTNPGAMSRVSAIQILNISF